MAEKKKYYNKWHYYPLYRVWSDMKSRCMNKNDKSYERYGGRGISVCEEWMQFKNFEKDMLSTYKHGLTIERIDNNGNYNKSNCRWATLQEQAQNTRNIERAFRITFNGKTKTIREWAEIIGIKRRTLSMRIFGYKWSIQKALTI